jgi:hypothetical protein
VNENDEKTTMLGLKERGSEVHLTRDQLGSFRNLTASHEHGVNLVQLEDLYVRLDYLDAEGTTVTDRRLLFPLGLSH